MKLKDLESEIDKRIFVRIEKSLAPFSNFINKHQEEESQYE